MEMETRKIKYSGLKTTLIFWSNMFSDAWGAALPEDSLLFRDSWLTSCTCNLISHWNLQELVPVMQWRAPQLLQTQSYLADLLASLLLALFCPFCLWLGVILQIHVRGNLSTILNRGSGSRRTLLTYFWGRAWLDTSGALMAYKALQRRDVMWRYRRETTDARTSGQ